MTTALVCNANALHIPLELNLKYILEISKHRTQVQIGMGI